MVENALIGRRDLIITKSVSRFAGNTVESLTTIRTIMSSLAQEESRSISENCTKEDIHFNFKDGTEIKV